MLTANQKYIDTANIKHLLSAGEKNADKIQIAVDRYYHQMDLSACLFTLRAVNSGGGLVMQNLEKEVTENQIILTWVVDESFTAVSGELLPEIVGQQDDTVVIKYEMTPMVVRNSILEQYHGGIDAIDKALQDMQSILAQAETLVSKSPTIQNGTWRIYDVASGEYQDTGYRAQGEKGNTGADGFSPSVKVQQTETGAVITITDQIGTTTATIRNGVDGTNGTDGKDGAKGEKGDAGTDGISPTITVTQTDTGAIITVTDANSTTSAVIENGKDGKDGSSETTDLTEIQQAIAALQQSSHTHTTLSVLNSISQNDLDNLESNLPSRIIALENSLGDISAALAAIVEVE